MKIRRKSKLFKLTTFFIGIFIILSCSKNTIYKQYEDIPSGVWDKLHRTSFKFEIQDTTSLMNVDIMVRNASLYPYRNLWLFIHQTAPDGSIKSDTLECILADQNGNWHGDGMGDIWDNKIPWRINYTFPNKGKYHYEIEHGMRNDKLPGIIDIGVNIILKE